MSAPRPGVQQDLRLLSLSGHDLEPWPLALARQIGPEHAAGAGLSVAVRGCPWKTDGLADRSHRTDAICPWMPQHSGSQRSAVTHGGTKQNGPRSREFAANGPFPARSTESPEPVPIPSKKLTRAAKLTPTRPAVSWLLSANSARRPHGCILRLHVVRRPPPGRGFRSAACEPDKPARSRMG